MTRADEEHFLVLKEAVCIERLQQLLPTLIITPARAVSAMCGGSLSPTTTVLCLRELQERTRKLMHQDLQHMPCRVDVAVAIYSIVCKLDLVGSNGLLGSDAWRVAATQRSHAWALHVHSARDAGPLKHLRALDNEMRPGWLLQIELSLLEVLGGGLWDVQRTETVTAIMLCICEDIDITACADDCGMLSPQTIHMYFCCSSNAILKAANALLLARISTHEHLPLFVYACLNTIDIFSELYYKAAAEPVHKDELSSVHVQVQMLVHAVVLLCEYVLLCGVASVKLAVLSQTHARGSE